MAFFSSFSNFQIMDSQSPSITKFAGPFEVHRSGSSSKFNHSLSIQRYTPSQRDEEKGTSLMELFQDSLEMPRIASRLLEFSENHGETRENLLVKPSQRKPSLSIISKPSTISELLQNLREKPKSSLKSKSKLKKQKTVSFCSQIELSSPDTLMDSVVFTGTKPIFEDSLEMLPEKSTLATVNNSIFQDITNLPLERNSDSTSSTQQAEFIKNTLDDKHIFKYEEEVQESFAMREMEFNEYSTVAYCNSCSKETVTEVVFEKYKGQGCSDITEWVICWVLPVCMTRKKVIIHNCAVCKNEIFRADY